MRNIVLIIVFIVPSLSVSGKTGQVSYGLNSTSQDTLRYFHGGDLGQKVYIENRDMFIVSYLDQLDKSEIGGYLRFIDSLGLEIYDAFDYCTLKKDSLHLCNTKILQKKNGQPFSLIQCYELMTMRNKYGPGFGYPLIRKGSGSNIPLGLSNRIEIVVKLEDSIEELEEMLNSFEYKGMFSQLERINDFKYLRGFEEMGVTISIPFSWNIESTNKYIEWFKSMESENLIYARSEILGVQCPTE